MYYISVNQSKEWFCDSKNITLSCKQRPEILPLIRVDFDYSFAIIGFFTLHLNFSLIFYFLQKQFRSLALSLIFVILFRILIKILYRRSDEQSVNDKTEVVWEGGDNTIQLQVLKSKRKFLLLLKKCVVA
jgi:hypothetical protein